MTKKQRLSEYRKVRREIVDIKESTILWYKFVGFCILLSKDLTKKNYPELWAYKPWYMFKRKDRAFFVSINPFRQFKGYWFDPNDLSRRIEILNTIIETMDKRKSKKNETNKTTV